MVKWRERCIVDISGKKEGKPRRFSGSAAFSEKIKEYMEL